MTRSFEKWDAEGALIERPGGGPFRLDVPGVLVCTPKSVVSCVRCDGPSLLSCALPGLTEPPFCRASMICLCWSRTSKLLCSCSRMAGSCVWKPGDRQARPTSCIARPADSREVSGADGLAVCGPRLFDILDERSRRLGRGRDVGMLGDPGSCLTLIIGGTPRRLSHAQSVVCTL